ncbi:hypothetical protein [Guptibacillus algicola]|nr:hypothetical protein [Alkalihalobacillus algicola]MCA0987728.1 hypothetical protein [Alkalihalobacillus algicola]
MRSETKYRLLAFGEFNAETNWNENNRLFNYSIATIGALVYGLSLLL